MSEAPAAATRTRAERLLGRLSRRTAGGAFIPEIDGLRFIAIAIVVLHHLNGFVASDVGGRTGIGYGGVVEGEFLANFLRIGTFGPHLFFVISGFVLALPFIGHLYEGRGPVSLTRYYLRRLTRLEPPYFLASIITYLLFGILGISLMVRAFPSFLAGMGYLHGLWFLAPNPLNPVTWSLEIEVQFYLLMPALAYVFRVRDARARRALIVGISLGAMLLQSLAPDGPNLLRFTFLGFLQFFFMGFLLADIYINDWKRAPVHARRFDLVAAAGWIALAALMMWMINRPAELAWWALPFVMLVTYIGSMRGPIVSAFFRNPWIFTFGGMCYSIYLLHAVFIQFIGRLTAGMGPTSPYWLALLVQGALLLPVVIGLCVLFFMLVERPTMDPRWPQKLSARVRRRAASEAVGTTR